MSVPASHEEFHAMIRNDTRTMVAALILDPSNADVSEQDIEDATDAMLSVLSVAWNAGFAEGREECCGMGAMPDPFVKEAS
jgi:hypothetical protein